MKKNNYNARFSLFGYFLFLVPLTLIVSFSILIYDSMVEKGFDHAKIALLTLLFIFVATLLLTLCDIVRRRIMVDRPVDHILKATEKIASGDLKVKLYPLNIYSKYDKYDLIMENINKMTGELSKNEVLKTEFISSVSHEIKTPLAVISNYAKALKNENLDKETKEKYLDIMVLNSQKLSNLVSNILKLNKLENQAIAPEKTKINVGELLRENILQFEALFEKKNIELDCKISDIELTIEQSYLELIFNNLISNAIKFTNDNGKIRISLINVNEYVEFSVEDNGVGISKEVGSRIFEKFYQADSSRSAEGNGLGLALVKKIIDIMGGELSVQSQEGKGSTFTVKIKRELYE